jgi:hypothetical protein
VRSPFIRLRHPRRVGDGGLLCFLPLPHLPGVSARELAVVVSLHPVRLRRFALYRTDVTNSPPSDRLPPAA